MAIGSFRGKLLIFHVCTVLLCCATNRPAFGREQQFAAANYAVTIPPDWENLTPKENRSNSVLALFGTSDQRHLMVVLKFGWSGPSDRWFVDAVERECARWNVGPKTSGAFVDSLGLKCYERRGAFTSHGLPVATFVRAIPTSEGTYFLEATVLDGEIEDTPDVQGVLASFRFIHPVSAATQSRTSSQLFRLSLIRYGIPLSIFGVLIVGILAVIGACLRLKRHVQIATSAPQRSGEGEPPPLPPGSTDRSAGSYDY